MYRTQNSRLKLHRMWMLCRIVDLNFCYYFC